MMRRLIVLALGAGLFLLPSVFAGAGKSSPEERVKLTHEDAAIILTKYSGLFGRHIDQDADMGNCVTFLNKHGIYFGLLEVISGSEFSKEDCARTLGQIQLVLGGEAELVGGKVVLPEKMASWREYCDLNDVKYMEWHDFMCRTKLTVGQME